MSKARRADACYKCGHPVTDAEFLRDARGDQHIVCPFEEPKPGVLCPGCGERATAAHLRANPACMKAAATFTALYSVARRKTVGKSTGRRKVLRPCPKCGVQVSTTEARYGHDGCTAVKSGDNGGKA